MCIRDSLGGLHQLFGAAPILVIGVLGQQFLLQSLDAVGVALSVQISALLHSGEGSPALGIDDISVLEGLGHGVGLGEGTAGLGGVGLGNLLHLGHDLVSDVYKRQITDYISEMLQKSAQTKNVLRSVDDFLNVVTQLKSVCFTQRRTLFTSKEDSIFKKQANLYGLDLPEKSKIRLDYGATPIGAAKNALRDWKMKRESGEFEDVIVVGMDDNGLESTFNFSTLISSVEINVIKDDDYRYEPSIVKALLVNQLGGANA